ncbi:MAG: glucuronate isomerase [Ruminococcaceae bacterium]|nr:glucuronate isomerase [Oscillospiraceae bacterium]
MNTRLTQQLLDTFLPLPHLFFDTSFSLSILTENRPYRNIGDLLIGQAPSVRQALRLCGATDDIVEGTASDYECFSALCIAAPMLTGHTVMQNITTLLSLVFDIETPLSPYACDTLWETLNAEIEERNLRPSDIAALLSVESLCYRVNPFEAPLTLSFPDIDLYPLPDLGDTPTAWLTSPSHHAESLDQFLETLFRQLAQYAEHGAVSVRLGLPSHFTYRRNSKRKELDETYRFYCSHPSSEFTSEALYELETAIAVSVAAFCQKNGLSLLLAPACRVEEVIALYRYLSLNRSIPETLVYLNDPTPWQPFFAQFTFRTEYGLPGLLPLSDPIIPYAAMFPLGAALLPDHAITDPIALASGYRKRKSIAQALAALGEAYSVDEETLCSLAEDIVYGNIKNRFGI